MTNCWAVTQNKFYSNKEIIDLALSNYENNKIVEAIKWFRCAFYCKFQTIENYVDYIHLLVKLNYLEDATRVLNTFNELYPISHHPESIAIYLPAAALAIALNEDDVAKNFLEDYIMYYQFEKNFETELPSLPCWSIVKVTHLELKTQLKTKKKENYNEFKKLVYYITIGKKYFNKNYLFWLKRIIYYTTNSDAKKDLLNRLSLIFKSKDDDLYQYFS